MNFKFSELEVGKLYRIKRNKMVYFCCGDPRKNTGSTPTFQGPLWKKDTFLVLEPFEMTASSWVEILHSYHGRIWVLRSLEAVFVQV